MSDQPPLEQLFLSGKEENITLGFTLLWSREDLEIPVFLVELLEFYEWGLQAHLWEPQEEALGEVEIIAFLLQLESLELNNHYINIIPKGIAWLQQLQDLSIVNCSGLYELPEELFHLSKVKSFRLLYTSVSKLPPALAHWQQLEELYLEGLAMEELAPVFELSKLKSLQLESIYDFQFPSAIAQLSQLEQLHLLELSIPAFPQEMIALQQLVELKIIGAQLQEIPTFVAQLSNLAYLDCSSNYITTLPDFLGQLQHLKQLEIKENELDSLPPTIGNWQQLEHLSVSNNALQQLPPSILQLNALKSLDLSYNQLVELPASIEQLVQLEKLLVHHNPLKAVPTGLLQLKFLNLLHINYSFRENPILLSLQEKNTAIYFISQPAQSGSANFFKS